MAKGKKRGSGVRQVEYVAKGYNGSEEGERREDHWKQLEEEGRTLLSSKMLQNVLSPNPG